MRVQFSLGTPTLLERRIRLEMNENIKGAMDDFLHKVTEIVKRIQSEQQGTKRMFVLVSAQCQFCDEYLSNLKNMQLEVQPKIFNVFATEEGQALSMLMRMEKFPATVFMGTDDKIKGVIYGIPKEEELKNELMKI